MNSWVNIWRIARQSSIFYVSRLMSQAKERKVGFTHWLPTKGCLDDQKLGVEGGTERDFCGKIDFKEVIEFGIVFSKCRFFSSSSQHVQWNNLQVYVFFKCICLFKTAIYLRRNMKRFKWRQQGSLQKNLNEKNSNLNVIKLKFISKVLIWKREVPN